MHTSGQACRLSHSQFHQRLGQRQPTQAATAQHQADGAQAAASQPGLASVSRQAEAPRI